MPDTLKPDDTRYFRPIPAADGLPLAGTRIRFRALDCLRRGAAPERIAADAAPAELLERLTAPRADFAGLALDTPRVMGIINVTPDSFSDGGLWADPQAAIAHGRALAEAGADFLDIGGESTRPGATELTSAEEEARVLPVVAALQGVAPVSIDTRKADVARAACAAGAVVVNDVTALGFDPAMAETVAGLGVPVVLMRPAAAFGAMPQGLAPPEDAVLDVYDMLEASIAHAEAAGIPRSRIAVDPGIGFGQSVAHNLALLRHVALFHGLGCAILLGVSRKGFIGAISGASPENTRDPGSLALTLAAVAQGVQIHRVHNVADTVQGLALWRAVTQQ